MTFSRDNNERERSQDATILQTDHAQDWAFPFDHSPMRVKRERQGDHCLAIELGENGGVWRRSCFARKKRDTSTINSGGSRAGICTGGFTQPGTLHSLPTTGFFESCCIVAVPLSLHATLRSHSPTSVSIFSAVFAAASVRLPIHYFFHAVAFHLPCQSVYLFISLSLS